MYDTVCVCETWLNANITDGLLLNNADYNIIRHDRDNNVRGGGVCIFVNKFLNFIKVAIPIE